MREKRKSLKQQQEQLPRATALAPKDKAAKDSSTFASSAAPNQSPHLGEWLTTGEAYFVAVSRGLEKSRVRFGVWLRDAFENGKLTPELEKIGLVADFDTRRKANPKDNSVRWLRFEG